MGGRPFKIGLYGSADGDTVELCEESARIIGWEVAQAKNILGTGACWGIPFAGAESASENGGLVLGFSPAIDALEHVQTFKLPTDPHTLIFTGMGLKGRNMICTRSCDAGIFIAGRWGTMNEFTFMCDEGRNKVIGLLAGSGGFVDSKIIPGLEETDKETAAAVVIENDARILIRDVFHQLALLYS